MHIFLLRVPNAFFADKLHRVAVVVVVVAAAAAKPHLFTSFVSTVTHFFRVSFVGFRLAALPFAFDLAKNLVHFSCFCTNTVNTLNK